jgi:hypothetical protein
MTRAENRAAFPYQYEGRKKASARARGVLLRSDETNRNMRRTKDAIRFSVPYAIALQLEKRAEAVRIAKSKGEPVTAEMEALLCAAYYSATAPIRCGMRVSPDSIAVLRKSARSEAKEWVKLFEGGAF